MKFCAHHFFSSLRIFYVKMAISEGGWWQVCISLIVTGPVWLGYEKNGDDLTWAIIARFSAHSNKLSLAYDTERESMHGTVVVMFHMMYHAWDSSCDVSNDV